MVTPCRHPLPPRPRSPCGLVRLHIRRNPCPSHRLQPTSARHSCHSRHRGARNFSLLRLRGQSKPNPSPLHAPMSLSRHICIGRHPHGPQNIGRNLHRVSKPKLTAQIDREDKERIRVAQNSSLSSNVPWRRISPLRLTDIHASVTGIPGDFESCHCVHLYRPSV